MNLEYLIIDVFTSDPFGGSRLNLFPDGESVPAELLQKLALEMGCGETAFVFQTPGTEQNRSRLRVFTPSAEIPFAGHSVLGATFAMDFLDKRAGSGHGGLFTWELDAGNYQVSTRDDSGQRVYSLVQDTPDFLGQYFHRRKVAVTLGLAEEEIVITGLPREVISTGLPIHIVPVNSLETMDRINLRRREADAIAADLGFGDLFVFTFETINEESTVHCRMFAPHFGIPEDPASGAATGALVAYLVKHRLIKDAQHIRVVSEQGIEMGRPSRLIAEAEIRDGKATNISVGGGCVLVGTGNIIIP